MKRASAMPFLLTILIGPQFGDVVKRLPKLTYLALHVQVIRVSFSLPNLSKTCEVWPL